VWEYIAADDVKAANDLLARVEHALDLLAEIPAIGHTRNEVRDPRYRFWTIRPYLIAYRFTARTLTVVRVIRGSRDFRRIFR
jgi:plasmid stabilization system protein ParE